MRNMSRRNTKCKILMKKNKLNKVKCCRDKLHKVFAQKKYIQITLKNSNEIC